MILTEDFPVTDIDTNDPVSGPNMTNIDDDAFV